MTDYIRLDTDALEDQGLVAAYQRAATLDTEAKRLQAAYRDELAVRLAAEHGPSAAARLLGISPATISKHRRRHKERTMPQILAWGEDPARTPAIRTRYRDGTAEAEAIGRTGPLARIRYKTSEGSTVLDDLVSEIAPWLPVLDALAEEDTALAARTQVAQALTAWESADDVREYDVREERYLWKELQEVVARHQTPADVAAAHQVMDARGIALQHQEQAAAVHIAARVIARLAGEAEEAHQRAVDAAPGPVPELLLWETPRVLGRSARSLRAHLDKRLS